MQAQALKENPMSKDALSLFVMHIKRNRTPSEYIGYSLYFYSLLLYLYLVTIRTNLMAIVFPNGSS
jgi:hypothetical protein